MEFGWGDEGFYQAETVTVGLALQAIFWPSDTVMHVVAVPRDPVRYFPDSQVQVMALSAEGLGAMLGFMRDSFARDAQGRVLPLGPGLYGQSRFFRARGSYWALNTCNVWTAEALHASGYPIRVFGALTAESVMEQLSGQPPCGANAWLDEWRPAGC